MALGSIVVTGASTGIGEACALHFDQKGFRVFAGVRKEADAEALRTKASDRLAPLLMDVTDPESIQRAAASLGRNEISGLINNAGIVVSGPIELLPLDQFRRQFEVNVLGQIAVTQAFLPFIRQGRGRIVNIGSIAGRSALPLAGAYSASKYALEAITDALRMELLQWGIHVAIVEPGAVQTPIWGKGQAGAEELMKQAPEHLLDLYRPLIENMRKAAAGAAQGASPVSEVVKAVDHAMTAAKPKTRYVVGFDAKVRVVMNNLPDRTRDRIILKRIDAMGKHD